MAGGTWVRDLILVRHCRRDELEGVRTDERAGDAFGLDLRHVTGYALTAWAAILVVSVLFEARGMRSVRRTRTVCRGWDNTYPEWALVPKDDSTALDC